MSAITALRPVHLALLFLAAGLLALAFASTSLAAPNPNSTGQPNASCGSANASVEPAGFFTTGFAHAETVYAGSGKSLDHSPSTNAVSQYDVACFQPVVREQYDNPRIYLNKRCSALEQMLEVLRTITGG